MADASWQGLVETLSAKGFGASNTFYDSSFKGVVRILQNLNDSQQSAYDYNWRGIIQALQGAGYGTGNTYEASFAGAVRAAQDFSGSEVSVYDYSFKGLVEAIDDLVSSGAPTASLLPVLVVGSAY